MSKGDEASAAPCVRPYVCGEDFCETCGDCLVCHGSDPCYGSGGPSEHHSRSVRDDDEAPAAPVPAPEVRP